jgi:hypothetical protein
MGVSSWLRRADPMGGLSEAVLKKSKVAFGMLVVDRVARQCLNEDFDRSLSLATVQCEFA